MKRFASTFPLLAATCLLIACAETSGTAVDDTPANVAGKWNVTLNLSSGGQTQTFTGLVFQISQSGTALTGTVTETGPTAGSIPGSLTGTVSGKNVTIKAFGTKSTGDDCGNYPIDLVIDATTSTTMTIKSGTGTDCRGDGKGGHTSLTAMTITGGTLTKQ